MATSIVAITTCTIINCVSAEVGSSVYFVILHFIIFIIVVIIITRLRCCCFVCDKQHYISCSYHSAHTLLQQLTNHIHPITSHCTDQAAYLCLLMLLLLHSTQPPPASVLLRLYAPWRVFISELITIGGLFAMVAACYLSLCSEFHYAMQDLLQQAALLRRGHFPKTIHIFIPIMLWDMIVYGRIKFNI